MVGVNTATPPDGGWGWIIVFGSFIIYFLIDGWAFSFGVLFPSLLEFFDEGKGKTSLIAALLYGIPMVISPVVCALMCCYGCRPVAIIGGLLTATSMIATTFAWSVNQICLTIGMMGSLGLSMTYLPALFIVTYYFEKRRGLAIGLTVTGSGLGQICFPPIMDYLLAKYALKGFLVIMGGLCLHIVFAACLFRPLPVQETRHGLSDKNSEDSGDINLADVQAESRPTYDARTAQSCTNLHYQVRPDKYRHSSGQTQTVAVGHSSEDLNPDIRFCGDLQKAKSSPELGCILLDDNPQIVEVEIKRRGTCRNYFLKHWQRFMLELNVIMSSMLDKSLARNGAYLLFCGSNFVLYLWIGVPHIFLIDRAVHLQIAGDLYFISSVIGIGRTVGQIILGYLGDLPQVSCSVLYAVSVVVLGIDTMLVPLCNSYASLCVYAAVYGFFVSVTYAIQMVCIVDIVGLEKTSSAFGLMQLFQGIATMLGTPLAGWLYDVSGGYDPTFYMSGAWMTFSGITMLPVVCLIRSRKVCS
ncbi:hypothetical protein LSH36_685g01030 [Paralvinella palmiformis]|uniref:Major facilitator superfamily (MFS) profile domain-containing protein n=1 Tax=Paralvinella palmiformis TaxID=53620 RepID=A0AAD9J2L7_9ANNE|nr:hypothetical protein LSH36_685g01030 [Paralvinella palmiformis]